MRIAVLVGCALAIGCESPRPALSLQSIEPAVVSAFVDTPVTLRGSGFAALVTVQVDSSAPPKINDQFVVELSNGTRLTQVVHVDSTTLTAVVPAAAPGEYDVTLIDPRGQAATLANALRVEAAPDAALDGSTDGGADASTDAALQDLTVPRDLSSPPDLFGVDLSGPSCVNGVRDGNETGVDCGGSCALACPDDPCATGAACVTGVCDSAAGVCVLASGPPSWQAAPSLETARWALGATNSRGTIYAAGGVDATNRASSVVETYAGSGGFTTLAAGMPNARSGIGAAAGSDGRVYTIDGLTMGSQYQQLVDVYDPVAGWSSAPVTPVAAYDIAGTSAAGGSLLYVMGGYNNTGTKYLDSVSVYSIASGSWSTAFAPLPTARMGLAVAEGSDARLYAVGGYAGGTCCLTVVEAYTPASNTWATVASTGTGRYGSPAVTAPDGRIYTFGGDTPTIASAEAYSIASNHWFALPSLVTPRGFSAGAVGPDGRVYAIGGRNVTTPLASVEAYGPTIALQPSSAAAGATVTVTGSNFATSAHVAIWFGATPIALGTTDATGAIAPPLTFIVPPAATGPQAVTARDVRSQYPVTATLTIP